MRYRDIAKDVRLSMAASGPAGGRKKNRRVGGENNGKKRLNKRFLMVFGAVWAVLRWMSATIKLQISR